MQKWLKALCLPFADDTRVSKGIISLQDIKLCKKIWTQFTTGHQLTI